MVQSCLRERAGLRNEAESASDRMVGLSGTTVAVACLACVLWTLSSDHTVESELASEGASTVIEPAKAPTLCPVPDGMLPAASLRIDDGNDVADKPVVNAHLEIVSGDDEAQVVDVSSMIRQLGFGPPQCRDCSRGTVGCWLTDTVEATEKEPRTANSLEVVPPR